MIVMVFSMVGIAALLALVIFANVEYSRTRAELTLEQREEFDEEERREMQIW